MKDIFLNYLRKDSTEIADIYYSLFSLQADLDKDLEYLMELASGKNTYFKEWGIENWFYSFHKSIRQIGFFDGNYRKVKYDLLSKEENDEYMYLLHCFRGEDKENKYGSDGRFTYRYRRYLGLYERNKREVLKEPSNGRLDSILYSIIRLDKDNVLEDILKKTFKKSTDGIF
jgi:hypothetical protein